MTDYYPLVASAVARLEENTRDTRRALYEHTRVTLVAQLRALTPAINPLDITGERFALEDAIRKVEVRGGA